MARGATRGKKAGVSAIATVLSRAFYSPLGAIHLGAYTPPPHSSVVFSAHASHRFVKSLDEAEPSGGTSLWDSIRVAANALVDFRAMQPALGGGAKLRILVLTDGMDTSAW